MMDSRNDFALRTRTPNSRRGFTLVELLVVIAIIGILVALLLPAIQIARESARRTQCGSNLKQIGLAMQMFHEQNNHFPIGCLDFRIGFPPDPTKKQLAWSAFLLPYLEQQPLYDSLDLNKPFDDPANAQGGGAILEVYLCPTSPRGPNRVDGLGPCDYGGINGERIKSPNNPEKGVIIYEKPISLGQITDGSSQTILISEDHRSPNAQWINGRNVFDQSAGINDPDVMENEIRSEHKAGANGLFADGSVRYLTESMDLDIVAAICTRARNDDAGDDF